ncbi:MarR family winged helix-turn-helix transcriptional regulator [Actinoplanes missouriensis]|nr:MarR family transcriptional regulator [Actinoplanes missouriensis]
MIWPDRLARLDAFVAWHAAQRAHRLLCDHLDTTGLRMQHYRVLAGMLELGECTQAELSRALELDAGNLVLLLGELEQREAVTRTPDPAHRRRNLVRPTDLGRQMFSEMDKAVNQANDLFLAPLDEAERAQFRSMLTRLVGDAG